MPIQDANSVALKAVQAAGEGGGVVLNFTPPEALKILQAAQQQGLQDRVKWGCSTPCNTDFLAKALGSAWNDKLFVNAELNLTNADGPDSNALPRRAQAVRHRTIPLRQLQPDGLRHGRASPPRRCSTIKGDYTVECVNEAILDVKDFKTDILCKPWYYGEAPLHIPNNTDRTMTPKDGKMVQKEDCFPISDADPAIAQVREIEQQGLSQVSSAGTHSAYAELGGLQAVHRHRPGPRRGVRPVRGRDGGALPGDRRAQPRLRRGRGDGRVHRVGADQQHRPPGLGRPTSRASLFGGVVTLAVRHAVRPAAGRARPAGQGDRRRSGWP